MAPSHKALPKVIYLADNELEKYDNLHLTHSRMCHAIQYTSPTIHISEITFAAFYITTTFIFPNYQTLYPNLPTLTDIIHYTLARGKLTTMHLFTTIYYCHCLASYYPLEVKIRSAYYLWIITMRMAYYFYDDVLYCTDAWSTLSLGTITSKNIRTFEQAFICVLYYSTSVSFEWWSEFCTKVYNYYRHNHIVSYAAVQPLLSFREIPEPLPSTNPCNDIRDIRDSNRVMSQKDLSSSPEETGSQGLGWSWGSDVETDIDELQYPMTGEDDEVREVLRDVRMVLEPRSYR
ncbi:hypothetical protein C8Q75DRAFT_810100 [Abortiporus biennis]|nr:hypothetical protein C8Q75DRAFT_810100 [Abortiporus biennis]